MKYTSKKEIEQKYNRKLGQLNRWYKSEIQKFDNGENVRKKRIKSDYKNIKKEAQDLFQKYCRLSRADKDGYVILLCSNKKAKRNECDGGHYFPKSNCPALEFEELNCRPISKRANMIQGDKEGLDRKQNLIDNIGQDTFDKLEKKSKIKIVRNKKYYEQQLQKWSEKLSKLLK